MKGTTEIVYDYLRTKEQGELVTAFIVSKALSLDKNRVHAALTRLEQHGIVKALGRTLERNRTVTVYKYEGPGYVVFHRSHGLGIAKTYREREGKPKRVLPLLPGALGEPLGAPEAPTLAPSLEKPLATPLRPSEEGPRISPPLSRLLGEALEGLSSPESPFPPSPRPSLSERLLEIAIELEKLGL